MIRLTLDTRISINRETFAFTHREVLVIEERPEDGKRFKEIACLSSKDDTHIGALKNFVDALEHRGLEAVVANIKAVASGAKQ